MDTIRLVLACDYGQTNHELGPQSILRLNGAMKTLGSDQQIVFVFAAGHLDERNARLCDLQKSYVESRGFSAIVPDNDHPNVWGTLAELRFFKSRLEELLKIYPKAKLEVYTADYHRDRTRALGERKVGLKSVNFIAVKSCDCPPSYRARLHECLGYLEVFLPDEIVAWMKTFRRSVLRRGIVRY